MRRAAPPPRQAVPSAPLPRVFHPGTIHDVLIRPLTAHVDHRGWLMEWFRHDELPEALWPHMAYVSLTLPGQTRGPHAHHQQSDLFAFVGPGTFKVYFWDTRANSPSYGLRQTLAAGEAHTCAVIVPPGVVHAYRNVGPGPAWCFNGPNRLYRGPHRREAADEIRYEGLPDSPFVLD